MTEFSGKLNTSMGRTVRSNRQPNFGITGITEMFNVFNGIMWLDVKCIKCLIVMQRTISYFRCDIEKTLPSASFAYIRFNY